MHFSQRVSVNVHRWEIEGVKVLTWEKEIVCSCVVGKVLLSSPFKRFTEDRAIYEALPLLLSINSWFLTYVPVHSPFTQFFILSPFPWSLLAQETCINSKALIKWDPMTCLKLFYKLGIKMKKADEVTALVKLLCWCGKTDTKHGQKKMISGSMSVTHTCCFGRV